MHYILDAYNFIHAVPEFEKVIQKNLEQSRAALIRYAEILLSDVKSIQSLCLVFDGSSEHHFTYKTSKNLHVIFTETGEDADDKILELLRANKHFPVAVVSNDNYVLNNTKALGVQILKVEEFLGLVSKTPREKPGKRVRQELELSAEQMDDINTEYMKHLGLNSD